MTEITELAESLGREFGLPVDVVESRDAVRRVFQIRPLGADALEGFAILTRVGLHVVSAEFEPSPYSAPLVRHLGESDEDQRVSFLSFAEAAAARGGTVTCSVNGHTCAPENLWQTPDSWTALELSVSKAIAELGSDQDIAGAVLEWGGFLLGMILSLLSREIDSANEPSDSEGVTEGAVKQTTVNRYERSHLNRAACIRALGTACRVCGFEFDRVYGPLGDGYVQVHHVVPVSRLGEGYVVNPAKDLVPVCANCHAMLHQRVPPLTIEELRELVRASLD